LGDAPAIWADTPLTRRMDLLTQQLETRRKEFHIPGMAIAVVKDDQVVLARGFGLADIDKKREVTPETVFAIGSTTKAFTATAIGMLVDEGKMQWDDPVTRHLPYFQLPVDSQDNQAEVTIRDLLCHRTGFTRMGVLWASGNASREEILRTAAGAKPWRPFRKECLYCNVTFMAAGEAAGAAAGSNWDDLVAQRIFAPLGMQDTNTTFAEMQAHPNRSLGYTWDEETEGFKQVPLRRIDSVAPAGAINSNVVDMAQWIRFQLSHGKAEGKRLISEKQLNETWSKQIKMAGSVDYGLGWMLQKIDGKRVVEHGGSIDGFAAEVGLFVEDNLGFVLLTNVTATPLQQLSLRIVAETMLGSVDAEPDSESTEKESDFDQFVGKYVANFGPFKDARFTVQTKNGKLAVDVPGQMLFELKQPDADGKRQFAITDQIAVSFERDRAGAVAAMKLYQSGLEFELPREGTSQKSELDREAVQKYLGNYRYDKDLQFNVTVVNDRLAVDIPGKTVFELHPPNDDGEWVFRATAQRAVKFVTEGEDVKSMIYVREDGESRELPRIDGATDADLPTVAQVLKLTNSAQRGAVFDRLKSLRLTASVRLEHSGVGGTSTFYSLGDDRIRFDFDLGRFGKTSKIINGKRGWTESNLQASEALTGEQLAQTWLEAPDVLFGDWRQFFDDISVDQVTEINGRKTIVVKLVAESILPITAYVDAESGDLVRSEMRIRPPLLAGLTIPVVVDHEDFREVNGLRMPWRSISSNDFSGRIVAQTDKVETDIEIDEELFTIPPPRAK
jgi:CubicO group peptidase (beta-lactamase class C family)